MPRTVLLHHETPDGSSHFDWLVARDGEASGRGASYCLTWRANLRVDEVDPGGGFTAQAAPEHRPFYLCHEGDVADGRGKVTRVASGEAQIIEASDSRLLARLNWGRGEREVEGEAGPGGTWSFHVHEARESAGAR